MGGAWKSRPARAERPARDEASGGGAVGGVSAVGMLGEESLLAPSLEQQDGGEGRESREAPDRGGHGGDPGKHEEPARVDRVTDQPIRAAGHQREVLLARA